MFHSMSMIESGTPISTRTSLGGFDMVLQSMTLGLGIKPLQVIELQGYFVTFVLQQRNDRLAALECLIAEHPHPKTLDKSPEFSEFCKEGSEVVGIAAVLKMARKQREVNNIREDAPVKDFLEDKQIELAGVKTKRLSDYLRSIIPFSQWRQWTINPPRRQRSHDIAFSNSIANCYVATTVSIPKYLQSPAVWSMRHDMLCRTQEIACVKPAQWPPFLDGAIAPKSLYREGEEAEELALEQKANKEDNKLSSKMDAIIKMIKSVAGIKDQQGNVLVSVEVRELVKRLVKVRAKLLIYIDTPTNRPYFLAYDHSSLS